MRLRGLVFERYAAFERVEVDLCDEDGTPLDVALFVGESGRGKTALVRGISGVLSEAIGAASELGADDVRRSGDPSLPNAVSRCRVVFDDVVDGRTVKVMAEKDLGPGERPVRGLPDDAYLAWRRAVDADPAPRAAFSVAGPGSMADIEETAQADEVDPLFDWFFGLRGGPAWESALRTLDRVLWPNAFDHVTPEGELVFGTKAGLARASELGDGFDSVLVMTLELLRLCTERPEEGLVYVIDDIDAHLHPRWQARIIADLRRVFPRVQILATTHSPWVVASVEPRHVFRASASGVFRIADRITKGAPVSSIMDLVFGTPDLPGPSWVHVPPASVRRDVLRALEDELPRGAIVYVLPEAIHARDVRDAFGELVLTSVDGSPGFLFFVDREPGKSWGHACEYVFRTRDGQLKRHEALWPPQKIDRCVAIART